MTLSKFCHPFPCHTCPSTELQLLDARENWAFLGWLLDERRLQFIEKVWLNLLQTMLCVFCNLLWFLGSCCVCKSARMLQ
jgi:hypothetical protein